MDDNIEGLLQQMTLEEKVSLLSGVDLWHTAAIDRLGIPSIKVTDGPNGARGGGSLVAGVKAACFPAEILLAATWNTSLVERVGQALAQEVKTKRAQVLLAPTVNIHRSPLSGRNFECFSEDPYLTARLATAYIEGVQSQGIGATVKHYVCNDSEFERNSISSEVGERALREIYLPPFKAAVQEAKTWAVMASYNKINGTFASENSYTLIDILRNEWGFEGVTMSDWYGTKSTVPSVNNGLDLEMPGPALYRGEKLLQAVADGDVSEAMVDEHVRHILCWIAKMDVSTQREEPEQALNSPEHRALIREAATEGIVLLKNQGNVLPLKREQLKSIAIIGPNAKTARIMAGGSAQINPHYAVTPYDGIVAAVGQHVQVGYEQGCSNYKLLPLLDTDSLSLDSTGKEHGFVVSYFNNTDFSGSPVAVADNPSSELMWFGQVPAGVNPLNFSARFAAHFTPRESGVYSFGLASAGLSRLLIDGQEIIDNWTHQTPGQAYLGMGSTEVTSTVTLNAGQQYALTIEYKVGDTPITAVHLGCQPPTPADALERAARLAASSDVALVFVGLSSEWESEGFDRPNMDLVGEQNELVRRVAAANENTVVILNTGSPVTMPWIAKVAAVLEAWYTGQECGNAIADILFGDVNPSGKLSQTFPELVEDNPAYINYPGENGKVYYGENLFVGYRYYDAKGIAPLFPFGYGLSYTTFEYSSLRLSTQEIGPDDTLQVSIDVTNTGHVTGKEIVQLYVADLQSRLRRPDKELKAFTKVRLEPGERQTVTFSIGRDALAYFDDSKHQWVAEAGEFEILVGASALDIDESARFRLNESSHWAV